MPVVFPGVGIADCRAFAGVVDIGRAGGLEQKRMARSDNSKSSWRMQGTLTSHDARPLPQPRSTRSVRVRAGAIVIQAHHLNTEVRLFLLRHFLVSGRLGMRRPV